MSGGELTIDVVECYHCNQLYWDEISDECPECSCPYIVERVVGFESDGDLDLVALKEILDSYIKEKDGNG